MVERKKTGKAKARKGVSALSKAAVLFTYPIFSLSSTLGSSVELTWSFLTFYMSRKLQEPFVYLNTATS